MILSALLFFCRTGVIGIFSDDTSVIETGTFILAIQLVASLFASGTGFIMRLFQVMEKGTTSTVMSVVRGILLISNLVLMNTWFGQNGLFFNNWDNLFVV